MSPPPSKAYGVVHIQLLLFINLAMHEAGGQLCASYSLIPGKDNVVMISQCSRHASSSVTIAQCTVHCFVNTKGL